MGNHRADRRGHRAAVSPTPAAATGGAHATGGKRRATRRQPPGLFRRIPAIPTIIGVVALAGATAGAVGMGEGRLAGSDVQLSASDSFSGTDAFSFTGDDPRSEAISRDTDARAQADTQARQLKEQVEAASAQRQETLSALNASTDRRADELKKNLWVLPTLGYHLTARFGESSGLWSHGHTGLDFAGSTGTPIFAIANGVIVEASYDGAYGYKTVQRLKDGTEIWYCHQSEIDVNVGEKVLQSEQIGRLGSTGNVTGPHLHLEVHPAGSDVAVDPYAVLVQHGVTP